MNTTVELPCTVGDTIYDKDGAIWYVNSIEILE